MKIQKNIVAAWAACKRKVKESFENSAGADIPEREEQEGPCPTEPMELNFHFPLKLESNLDQINRKLDRFFFSAVTIDMRRTKTYLATETKRDAATGEKTVRYWLGFDECVLCCEPPKEGEAFRFQINTMTADKSETDCGKLWDRTYPQQQQRNMVVLDCGDRYGVLVTYHAKIQKAAEHVPQKVPARKIPAQENPAASAESQEARTRGKCGDALTWSLVEDTLYIQGYGAMSYRHSNWFPGGDRIRKAIILPGCTEIGNAAFEGCTGLTSVMIPDTVTGIRWSAFRGCKSLTEVLLPNGVTEIGDFAFQGCSSLARAEIPGSVKQIGGMAFKGCTGLKNLVIPDSVWKIGLEAFQDVLHIQYTGSAVSANNWGAKNRNGGNRMPEPIPIPVPEPAAKKASPGPTPIPAHEPVMKKAPLEPFTLEFHFSDRKETDLDRINADLAQYELSNLKLLDYKGYLATQTQTDMATGEQTVRYWYGIDDCVLRCTPAKPGECLHYRLSTMAVNKTVRDCADLWKAANPDRTGRRMIELEFANAYALLVVHHEKLKTAAQEKPAAPVAKSAGSGSRGSNLLRRYEGDPLPDAGQTECEKDALPVGFSIRVDVENIKLNAAESGVCGDNLTWRLEGNTLTISGTGRIKKTDDYWEEEIPHIKHLVIEPGCTAIARGVFRDHINLETIRLPDTLKIIAAHAFSGCTSLLAAELPDSVFGLGIGAFSHCEKLQTVKLSHRLREISPETFNKCESLEKVWIPDEVTTIGDLAFAGVKSLRALPKKLKHLGRWALSRTTLLEDNFPAGLATIGPHAFYNTKGLTEVWLTSCMEKIAPHAFWNCSDLRKVWIGSGITEIGEWAFDGCGELENIHIGPDVHTIGRYAFCGCRLKSVSIPDSVTNIESCAFQWCKQLSDLKLGSNINRIGTEAFSHCPLEMVRIPSGVSFIGRSAFLGAKHLMYNGPLMSEDNWGAQTWTTSVE